MAPKKEKKIKTGTLAERLIKSSKSKFTSLLEDSELYEEKDKVNTEIPMLNIALSGEIDGGFEPGVITIAGPSKHFKTSYGLKMCKAFQDKYEDGLIIYIDSEFGSPPKYIAKFGLDTRRIIHIPVDTVECMKTEVVNQLGEIERGDHVMIFIDSAGAVGSEKEISDAEQGDVKGDFTRAKELNSFYRIIIPKVNMRGITCVVINHTYKTIEMFAKDKLKGGEGGIYASNVIWFITRAQETEGQGSDKELMGFTFTIVVDKSRYIREKSKFPITVLYDKGILKYSGMGELAEELGVINKTTVGKRLAWEYINKSTGETQTILYDDAIVDDVFWNKVLKETDLKSLIKTKYLI